MIVSYTDRTYRISYQGLSLVENALGNPSLVQVSVLDGCTILVAPQPDYGITYLPNGEYRSWRITGYNTRLARSEEHFIYIRLSRQDNQAMVVFSVKEYGVDGSVDAESGPSSLYYYIRIGRITATDSVDSPSLDRQITVDFGFLSTPAGSDDGSWKSLFSVTADDLILPLKKFASFVTEGVLSVIGKISLNGKTVSNIARQSDTDKHTANDESVPTTGYLSGKYLDFLRTLLLRKDQDEVMPYLLTFLKGLQTEGFTDSILAGKGTGVMGDRIQTGRMEVRDSLTVLDLVINEIHAMSGDWSLSDCGAVEGVELISEHTYRLSLRRNTEFDFTSLQKDDILYSIVNTLLTGGSEYYTSWMRVLNVNTSENTITVVLYPDSEVPGGKNYPPVAGYNVTRRGNSVLPESGHTNERSQSWLLSSREGRIMFLANVYKPILEDYNYALTIGKIPNLKALDKLPVSAGEVGVVAQTVIAEKFWQFDYNGDVVPNVVDRGLWSAAVASGNSPYRFVQKESVSSSGTTYTTLEQHTVQHYGCKWACLIDKTQLEPVWNSPAWSLVEGDTNYYLSFLSDNGWAFSRRNVNLNVTAQMNYANRDISQALFASEGTEVEWLRDTGDVASDNAWRPSYVDGRKDCIHLSLADMGSGWGITVRTASFICRVFIPVGDGFTEVTNSVMFKM